MKITALALTSVVALLVAAGCGTRVDDGDAEGTAESQEAPLKNTGGGGTTTTKSCEDKYGDCYIDCSLKNTDYKEGCFDSCDAAYRICKWLGSGSSSGGVVMY